MGMFGWSYPAGAAGDPYAPYNDTTGEDGIMEKPILTKSQKAKIRRIRANLERAHASQVKPVIWADYWAQLADYFLEIKTGAQFAYENECDGDHYPVQYSEDEWGKCAYALDHGRDEDGLYIRANRWDGEDWEYVDEMREGCTDEEFAQFQRIYMDSSDYFRAWAEYFLWCAENGGDPVDAYWKKENATTDAHIKAAQDNVKTLLRACKKAGK